MIPQRVWREMRRQPRWLLWAMLLSASCTCASLLMRGPHRGFGGPVLYFVGLGVSGALLVSSVVLLLLRAGTGDGDGDGDGDR